LARVLEAYLAELEAGRPVEVETLIAAHPEIADRLRRCLDSLGVIEAAAAVPDHNEDIADSTRATLGDYRIMRELGRGGMGVVYEAEQLSLGRRVALKVLPFAAALDPPQLARFKLEAQAAAQLHHTNIVPVYSVGVERGVHYYAMQFIDGRSLADLIRELRGPDAESSALARDVTEGRLAPPSPPATTGRASPSPSRRREFFRTAATLGAQAADALDYAHRCGIIHRDIKPANLLVDASGRLWVTDFGLARLGDEANLTLSGDLMGTLRYLSPERASGSRVGYDQRTDVYSLGVTLYELLALRPTFEGSDRADLLRRIVAEEPRRLRAIDASIPADLETIVQKAMAKEPESRYASAQDLADDLRRFLEQKPIHARRPSVVERAVKWSRRHAGWVSASAVVLALAVGGLAVGIVRVSREQTITRLALKQADERTQLARRAVDEMYSRFARDWLAKQPKLEPVQREFLEEALRFYEAFSRERARDSEARSETARAFQRVGDIRQKLHDFKGAESAYDAALPLMKSLASEFPKEAIYRDDVAKVENNLGVMLLAVGRTDDALACLRRSLEAKETLARDFPDEPKYLNEAAGSLSNLAVIVFRRGQVVEAEKLFRKAVDVREKHLAAMPSGTKEQASALDALAQTLGNLALCFNMTGRARDAEEPARRSIGHARRVVNDAPSLPAPRVSLARCLNTLGIVLAGIGRESDAIEAIEESVSVWDQLATDSPTVPDFRAELGAALGNLGRSLNGSKRPREAVRHYERAIKVLAKVVAESPDVPRYREQLTNEQVGLANLLVDPADAPMSDIKHAVELAKDLTVQKPKDASAWFLLGKAQVLAGEFDAAIAALEKANPLSGSPKPSACFLLAIATHRRGESDVARRWYTRGVEASKGRPLDGDVRAYREMAETALGIAGKADLKSKETKTPSEQ
jgi:serine/threonine protein kinase